MRQRRTRRKSTHLAGSASIKTTFLELIRELAQLTNDDNLVVAAVRDIFSQYSLTMTRRMAPVKLVSNRPAHHIARRRPSCWA
jgi:hypothetical protein